MSHRLKHVVFGAGALGVEVANQLVRQGADVRVVSRNTVSHLPGAETLGADLSEPSSASVAAKGADVIYFCVAPPYHEWTQGFWQLQEAAIAAAHRTGAVLVAAENLYGYGVAGDLTEQVPLAAKTRKGSVRARMSNRLFEAHSNGEIDAVSGRASDFFGPTVRQSALGERFWPNLLAGKPVSWFGDPDARHSFTYLPDFAAALITLATAPDSWGRAWHVPCPEPLTVSEVSGRAATIATAAPARLRRTPRFVLRLVGMAVPAAGEMVEMEYAYAEDFVVRQDDWNARFDQRATPWDAALRATIQAWRPRLPTATAA